MLAVYYAVAEAALHVYDEWSRDCVTRVSESTRRARFAGKLAAVTGGSSGIGFGVAKRLLELGARVVLVADHEPRLASAVAALGGADAGVSAVTCDIGRPDEVVEAMARLVRAHGVPDS